MKYLVWVFGALLLLSFVFPNGLPMPVKPNPPAVTPAGPVTTDPVIVKLLANATPADLANVNGIYSGLKTVIERDNGALVTTTEKWALLQANTLKLAVEQVNKYPGLDVAIDNVFKEQVGTMDVAAVNADMVKKLATACEIIANSAARR
jgi:hypothetical protein